MEIRPSYSSIRQNIMIIRARRIRNVQRHLSLVPQNAQLILGVGLANVPPARRMQIGFPENPNVNDTVVPARVFGPVSRFNADGGFTVHRDRPMQQVWRTMWREWDDWHGNRHGGFVDMPYWRYPRTPILPPGVEFKISATTTDERLITVDPIQNTPANYENIRLRINLFLEVFGECEIFTQDLDRIIQAPVVRLHWNILPRGVRPWPDVLNDIEPIIRQAPAAQRPVIQDRLEQINHHHPDFVATGHAGFTGYVIFGFPQVNCFVLESIFFGNATYVLGQHWQALSQLSKAELINGNLHQARIIHADGWAQEINALLP